MLKNVTISRDCSASMDSVPNVCCVVLVSSHAFLRASASSLLTLWPRHVRCIRLEAFRRSRSCWRCCLSCWALATVFWVPEAEGDQVLAANGFRFWPERLTWRGRRELPLNVWNISNRCFASFGGARAFVCDLSRQSKRHAGEASKVQQEEGGGSSENVFIAKTRNSFWPSSMSFFGDYYGGKM